MLTKTEKSRRSTILDEIRENSLDEKWLDEQLDFFETSLKTDPEIVILSNWICIGDPFMDINGTIMKKIDSKQFTSIDFIQKKLSEFYSDFLDENKLNKETESILGFSSEIDKENTKGYNFSTDYLKTLVKNLSNKKNLSKNQIESIRDAMSSKFQELMSEQWSVNNLLNCDCNSLFVTDESFLEFFQNEKGSESKKVIDYLNGEERNRILNLFQDFLKS